MRRVRQAIVVEGKYDAIRVRSAVEAIVIETDGFRIFRDPPRMTLLRRLAADRGLIVLTDSDSAGAVIRNHLLGAIPAEQLRLAYVPPIPGKERRKRTPSREGLLGVEGMSNDIVLSALVRAGAVFEDANTPPAQRMQLKKADLVACGLSGGPDSAAKRRALLACLQLPENLSANRLLEVVNATVRPEEWAALLEKLGG